ncbi:MAG: hypothetical protein ACI9FB_001921 [Candidatus Azotimanducaceae bacterium]|jgi:hypothetical protein
MKPKYYEYARKHIECHCPKCFCPHRGTNKYSFVYVCEERKFIYYDVPKNASTTIRQELFDQNLAFSMQDPQRNLQEYFKFAFIRNPWDRMVSNWKMFTTQEFRIEQLRSMTGENVSSFADFVHFSAQKANHHWQPQVLYMPDELDFVGRVDLFHNDFNSVLNTIGCNERMLSKSNVTERKEYWYYYTPELVDYVAEIYSTDIERFGFSFVEGVTP